MSSMAEMTPYVQVMDEMTKGKVLAARLQGLLRDSPDAALIADQILLTFCRAMDAANAAAVGTGEGSEVQSEVTCGGKRKAAAAGGERRGTSRRRTMQSGSTKVVKNIEDGQAWRKYGQKDIHNSNHPKSYFRCTHKYDQNCAALRQVQRCDADPDSFIVTYIGAHTCRDPHHPVAAPPDHQTGAADGLHAGSQLLCFANTSVTTYQAGVDGALLLGLKQEGGEQEEVRSCLTPGSSAGHSTAAAAAAAAAGACSDQGAVTSAPQFYGDGADFGEFFGLEDIINIKLCE